MKAAHEQNLNAPLQLVLIGPTHEFFGKMFGPNLNGIMTIGHWSPFQAKWPKAMPFYEAYTKRFNESPDYLDVPLAYMSCEILAHSEWIKEFLCDLSIDQMVQLNSVLIQLKHALQTRISKTDIGAD